MIYFDDLIKKAKGLEDPYKQVLAVSGSPRKGGNTDIIVKQIIKGLSTENINGNSINLSNIDYSGCIGCEKCRKDMYKASRWHGAFVSQNN